MQVEPRLHQGSRVTSIQPSNLPLAVEDNKGQRGLGQSEFCPADTGGFGAANQTRPACCDGNGALRGLTSTSTFLSLVGARSVCWLWSRKKPGSCGVSLIIKGFPSNGSHPAGLGRGGVTECDNQEKQTFLEQFPFWKASAFSGWVLEEVGLICCAHYKKEVIGKQNLFVSRKWA